MKVYLLELTDMGYDHIDDCPIMFSSLVVKASCISDARAIATAFTGDIPAYSQIWIKPQLSTCRNIIGCGKDNSVLLWDSC